MKALVTGSHGFVGRRLVKRLLQMDYDVVGVDDLSTGLIVDDWVGPAKLTADERDRLFSIHSDIRGYFRNVNPPKFDLIFHCAAVVGGRATIEGDPLKVAIDLSIDAEFFNWLVRTCCKARRIVYFSSSAVYPVDLQQEHTHCLLSEPLVNLSGRRLGMPDMSYGFAKLAGEYLAKLAVEKYQIPVVIYRPFSGYGEDQDLTYPFPAILQRVGRREDPITIWGSGTQVRDWVHIDDIVDCVFTTMVHMLPGETLNIGSGVGTPFGALADRMRHAVGHYGRIVNQSDQPAGVHHRVADIHKLQQFWQPKIDLVDGITRVHEHQKAQGMLG